MNDEAVFKRSGFLILLLKYTKLVITYVLYMFYKILNIYICKSDDQLYLHVHEYMGVSEWSFEIKISIIFTLESQYAHVYVLINVERTPQCIVHGCYIEPPRTINMICVHVQYTCVKIRPFGTNK